MNASIINRPSYPGIAPCCASTDDHPPKPPKPNVFWHLGKIVFNKTYFHTVPKGRI